MIYIIGTIPVKGIRPVAGRTISRESSFLMIRVGGGIEVIKVAIDAVIADPIELKSRSGGVTVGAAD